MKYVDFLAISTLDLSNDPTTLSAMAAALELCAPLTWAAPEYALGETLATAFYSMEQSTIATHLTEANRIIAIAIQRLRDDYRRFGVAKYSSLHKWVERLDTANWQLFVNGVYCQCVATSANTKQLNLYSGALARGIAATLACRYPLPSFSSDQSVSPVSQFIRSAADAFLARE